LKHGNPVNTETIQMTAQAVINSLKTVQQDFKPSNGSAIRFMHGKG